MATNDAIAQFYRNVEKGANRRFDATLAQQAQISKAQLDMQYQIARLNASTEAERLEVDRWYKQQQVQLAERTFNENIRQFDQSYGLEAADMSGWFQGQPTLEREQFLRQAGIDEAALTGVFGGQATLEAQRFAEAQRQFQQTFGLDERQFAEAQRQFQQTFGLDERQFEEANRQFQQRFGLDLRQFEEAQRQFQQTFGEQQRQFNVGATGYLTGPGGEQQTTLERERFAEAQRQFAQQFGLQQQQFGLQVGQAASDIRSRPDMIFQYGQFARDLPGLLAGQGGTPASGIQGAPQGQTIAGQLGELGLGGWQGPWQPASGTTAQTGYLSAALPGGQGDPTLRAIGDTYQRGFQALGAQALEGMDENEQAFLASGGTFLGYDPRRAGRAYQRSRLGQQVGA